MRKRFGLMQPEHGLETLIGPEVIRWSTRIRRRLHGGGDEVIIEKRGGVGVRIDIVGGGREWVITWVPKGGSCSHMPVSMMTPPPPIKIIFILTGRTDSISDKNIYICSLI